MTSLKRSALALGAAALMTVSLAACGSKSSSDAPTDASKADFCSAWKSVASSVTGASDEAAFNSLQDAVKKLKDVGTPSEITPDARAGYEVVVNAILKASWNDVKDKSGADVFPGVSDADKTKTAAFGVWVGTECAP